MANWLLLDVVKMKLQIPPKDMVPSMFWERAYNSALQGVKRAGCSSSFWLQSLWRAAQNSSK